MLRTDMSQITLLLVGCMTIMAITAFTTTGHLGTAKDVNRKVKAFLASFAPEPTYALNPTSAQQMDATTVTHVSGTLASNQTWSPAGGLYVVDGSVIVPSGKTLTINAGTTIKFTANGGGISMQEGTLKVNGTSANPVVFTSLQDDSVGGDTNEDGPSFGSWNDYSSAVSGQGSVTVKFSILRYGQYAVVSSCYASGGSYSLTDNVFNSAVQIYGCAQGKTALSRNQFGVQVNSALRVSSSELSGVSMAGSSKNTFLLPDEGQAVELDNSYVAQSASWTVAPGQVLMPLYTTIDGALNLYGGAVAKMRPNTYGFQVSSTGNFNAAGTGSSLVTFTSINDDSVAGDTAADGETVGSLHDYGVAVVSGGTTKLVKAVISYASQAVATSCYNVQTQLLIINNSTLNSQVGVGYCDGGKVMIDRNVFNMADDYALEVYGSDVRNILLGGANRNTFTGADKGKVAHFINAYVPEGYSWNVDGNGGQVALFDNLSVAGAVSITSGAIIKTGINGQAIGVEQSGTLNVTGTGGSRVVFTSIRDDSIGGDSAGDGSTSGTSSDFSQAINASGVVNVQYANMRNMTTAISAYCPGGLSSLSVTDTYIRSNVAINSCAQDKVSLKRNSFTIDRDVALNVYSSALNGIILTGADRNVFNGTTARSKAFLIQNSYVPTGVTWDLVGSGGAQPVVSSLRVLGTLNVAAGTVIKVQPNNEGLNAGEGGTINVNGTSSQRVTFTSLKDDSINGDTGGDGATTGTPADSYSGLTIGKNTTVRYAAFRNFSTGLNASCQSSTESVTVEDSLFASPASLHQCYNAVATFKRNQFNVANLSAPMYVNNSEVSGVAMSGVDANTFTGTGIRKTLNLYNAYVTPGRTWQVSSTPGAVLVSQATYVQGTMKIDPGVVVKSQANGQPGIAVEHGGTLQAVGSVVSPITFTSLKDDATGGDSGGDGTTTAGPRDSLAIRSYGNTTVRYASFKNMTPAVDTACQGYNDTSLEMTDNTMRGSINLNSCGSSVITLKRNQFNVTVGPAITLHNAELSGISMTGADKNTFTGGGQKQTLYVNGGYVGAGNTWSVDGSSGAVLAAGSLYIDGSLHLGQGLVVKTFNNHNSLFVSASGHLNIDGSSSSPVIVTSIKDDSLGGDSGGDGPTSGALRDGRGIVAGGHTEIHHAVIRNNYPSLTAACNNYPLTTLAMTDTQINGTVNASNCQAGQISLQRNQFASPFGSPLTVYNTEMSGIDLDGTDKNTFTGTDIKRAVQVTYGQVDEGRTWNIGPDTGAVYVLNGTFVSGTMIVRPGTIIKIQRNNSGFEIAETAHFMLDGSPGSPITVTSLNDDSIGGDSGGDKAATAAAKSDYSYAVHASGNGNESELDIEVSHVNVKYAATGFFLQTVAHASIQDSSVQHAQLGVQLNTGQVLYRGSFSDTDRGVQACNWGSGTCSVDASYTDWGNASGPQSCGAVLTDHWIYNGTTHDFSIFGSPNCDGSTFDPGADYAAAQQSFNQSLNPYQIDCSNGFQDACDLINMTMQCLAAAQQLAISNSTFPIDPGDVLPSTIQFGADTYVDSIAEAHPAPAARYHAATGILQVINIFQSLSSAYGQCHP
jgi:hypothetical protein